MPSLTLFHLPACKYTCTLGLEARKERHSQCRATHVWGLVSILLSAFSIPAIATFLWIFFSSPCLLTFLYNNTPSAFTLSNDCERLMDLKLDLSQFYHLFDAYYVKVLESECSSGSVQICVFKDLSTSTAIILEQVSAKDSPLCDHNLNPNCLPSSCLLGSAHHGLDNWLGLSLLNPNQLQTNSYLILNIGTNEEYRKNLTDQPQLLRDVWLDTIPECRTLIPTGLASLVMVLVLGALWLVLTCAFLPCVRRECKRQRRRHSCNTGTPVHLAVYKVPTGNHSATENNNGLTGCEEDELNEVSQEPSVILAGSPDLRLSRKSSISAKSEKGHLQGQDELVGSYITMQQLCSGSPTNRAPLKTNGSSSPSIRSPKSLSSAETEQGRDQGVLAVVSPYVHAHQLCTAMGTLVSPKVSSAPVLPLWSDQQQALLQDIEELVVLKVAADWEPLAIYLGVEPTLIDIIKKSNPFWCGDSCHEMFCSWIKKEKGTGGQPRTWCSVVHAIRRMGLDDLADQLRMKESARIV